MLMSHKKIDLWLSKLQPCGHSLAKQHPRRIWKQEVVWAMMYQFGRGNAELPYPPCSDRPTGRPNSKNGAHQQTMHTIPGTNPQDIN